MFFWRYCNGKMHHNLVGQIAIDEWLKTPIIRPDMNIELGEFVVMPNHIHGIISIGQNEINKKTSLKTNEEVLLSKKLSPQKKNISSIIRGYKSSVTTQARNLFSNFKWQPRFHDHIIRSHDEYLIVSEYIRTNPINWNNRKDILFNPNDIDNAIKTK